MKALIAMSGGVDSSVAAFLMREQGYECIGCTMKLYSGGDAGRPDGRTCCALSDTEDARSVASALQMRYYVFNMEDEFRRRVIRKFADSYVNGLTPNPCIDCNRYLKFGLLYERAKILGCEKIVTGHYARIECRNGRYCLLKAKDPQKDQSYVLYAMTQEQLAHTEFPLGNLAKNDVRIIAEEQGFVNARKPDSQDICFVPDGDYAAAIRRITGKEYPEGYFTDIRGNILGKHKGIIHYTVGQRRGLGISAQEHLYVLRICPEENRIVLGTRAEQRIETVSVTDINWIADIRYRAEIRCGVRLRYHQPEQPAAVYPGENGTARVVFDSPQRAAAPGQAAVFYDGESVLGGGTIAGTDDPGNPKLTDMEAPCV